MTQSQHNYHLQRLSKQGNFATVWEDDYYQKYFIEKYAWNLPLFAWEVLGVEFTYQQIDIWNEYVSCGGWEGARVAYPSGHGCHGINTPILMHNKKRKMIQKIKVGDLIMGRDYKPRKVRKLWRGRENRYTLTFSNGIQRTYNKSHKMYVTDSIKKEPIRVILGEWLKDQKGLIYVLQIKERRTFLIEIVGYKEIHHGRYYGIEVTKDGLYLDGDYLLTSNSGKTKFIGALATLHLLAFRSSITRVQAPKLDQVTKYSFKEITTSLNAMGKTRKITEDKTYTPVWGFLLNFIQINIQQIYIKGYKTDWYIEAVTAPKGDSTNLSGQHQLNYLLIFDEASGIEDSHIEASLGALSEDYNSCFMFSQHTKRSGKFHEAVTVKSKAKGGVWGGLRLSSRQSPRVSREQLKNWLISYTAEEIRVRIDGLPPKREMGMLISQDEVSTMYEKKSDIHKKRFSQIAFSYDLGYSGYRDSSILTASEVAIIESKITERTTPYHKILDIQENQGLNGKLPIEYTTTVVFPYILEFLDEQAQKGIHYDTVYVIGDATAGGKEAYVRLEELLLGSELYNFVLKGLQWGTERMYYEDKERFLNARAKGYVNLKEALMSNRIISLTQKHKSTVYSQLSQTPFVFTSQFKYKMIGKEEMKRKNIPSPDIGDTLAQLYLINYEGTMEEHEEDNIEILDEDMEELYSDDDFDEYKEVEEVKTIELDLPYSIDDEF